MKKHTLNAVKRDVIGKKVKAVRKAGNIPATVYGKNVPSESISMAAADFAKTYAEAGETGLVELSVGGAMRPVLIHTVQRDAMNGDILHVEFHQVDLKEKVHANVPIALVGEATAVTQKVGAVLSLLSEVEVEALPADLPEKIEVDISGLAEVGQEIKVSDLKAPSGVVILSDAAVSVVRIGELVSKAAEEQAAAEAAAATPAEEGASAEAGAETEKASEEAKPEEAK